MEAFKNTAAAAQVGQEVGTDILGGDSRYVFLNPSQFLWEKLGRGLDPSDGSYAEMLRLTQQTHPCQESQARFKMMDWSLAVPQRTVRGNARCES